MPQTCKGGGVDNVCGCTPTSCTALLKNCGSVSDGCGGTLGCGTCQMPNTCGGGNVANVCGCTPTTCAAQGKTCGTIPNGCGGTVDCGTCVQPKFCSGANVCVSASCGDGVQNGSETDLDCGGPDCAHCANGKTCGGNGDCLSANCVGGTCKPPPENCTNGIDDDQDGLTDCADPDCTTVTCSPVAPPGWLGPVELFDGDPAALPACGGAYPNSTYSGNNGLSCAAASCSACDCAAPTGVSCSFPIMAEYTAGVVRLSCSGAPALVTATGVCQPISNKEITIADSTPSGGSCTPSGGVPTTPSAAWSTSVKVCESSGFLQGGCGAGSVCAAKPQGPFVGSVCVYSAGDVACPGGFANKHLSYGTFNDTRGCTTCGCGGATGVNCSGEVTFYSAANCPALGTTTQVPFPTHGCLGPVTGSFKINKGGIGASGGSCTKNGGDPNGACTPATPTTICCL